jgi:hypothetical protein
MELQLVVKPSNKHGIINTSQQSAAELAIAAAIGEAAVPAEGSSSSSSSSSSKGGLCICHCKLAVAGLNSTAILQALPGSCLTSLEMDMNVSDYTDPEIYATIDRLAVVLPSLQQLRELHLNDNYHFSHMVPYDAVLSGLGALTSLTGLTLPDVSSGKQGPSCSAAQTSGVSVTCLVCKPWLVVARGKWWHLVCIRV